MCGGRFSIARRSWSERVAGADRGADLGHQQAALARHLQDFAQRNFQVLLDVVAQAPSAGIRRELRCGPADRPSSAFRTSRSMQARNAASVLPDPVGAEISVVSSRQDMRPSLFLRFCWRSEAPDKPVLYEGSAPRLANGEQEGTSVGLFYHVIWTFVNSSPRRPMDWRVFMETTEVEGTIGQNPVLRFSVPLSYMDNNNA